MARKPDPNLAAAAELDRLDSLLQHPARLGACVLLSRVDALTFSRLKELLGETDGNLGAQLRKLEDSGYVAATKEFNDRKPVTWYEITAAGARALRKHLAAMEGLIRNARSV